MKKADVLLIAAIVLLAAPAALVWRAPGWDASGRAAVVTWGSLPPVRIPLEGADGDYLFGETGQVVIRIEDGRAYFAASDCPDQICVRGGRLGAPGSAAACLPNRCALRIERARGADVDIVVG